MSLLENIQDPADLKRLSRDHLSAEHARTRLNIGKVGQDQLTADPQPLDLIGGHDFAFERGALALALAGSLLELVFFHVAVIGLQRNGYNSASERVKQVHK